MRASELYVIVLDRAQRAEEGEAIRVDTERTGCLFPTCQPGPAGRDRLATTTAAATDNLLETPAH